MYIINLNDNSIQNTNMETSEDLINNGYDPVQWIFANDSLVTAYQFQQAVKELDDINQMNYDAKRNGIEVINGVTYS